LISDLVEERVEVGPLVLELLRPRAPDELLDEEAFADDEFLPYWAELWPAALALAGVLPDRLDGVRVVELGCGLGVPALVAAARGGGVTALDWAAEAIELLNVNAERNGIRLDAVHGDWRSLDARFDLVLGADLLYEARNAEALLEVLPALAPEVLLAEPGRPHAGAFFARARERWSVEELGDRVYRLR
jgi:predicted nicotinamide N-methyase